MGGMDERPKGEFALIDWLRGRSARAGPDVALGIGDDMAILEPGGGRVLIASDMVLDGVHVDRTRHSPAAIGRKAVACNLSDCAAMAVRPVAVVASAALPTDADLQYAQALLDGMQAICEEFCVALVGGDTTSWAHPLAIDVAILAEAWPGVEPVRRSGARPGDAIGVTGPLGGSLLGRHLSFTPRVREARELAGRFGAHAMIDVSDGLAADLGHICRESGVGASLDEAMLAAVVSPDARRAAEQDGRDPLDHALGDGEDFELIVTAPPADIEAAAAAGLVRRIGEVVAGEGITMRGSDGSTRAVEPRGWEHFQ